jgi:hypothetical protein
MVRFAAGKGPMLPAHSARVGKGDATTRENSASIPAFVDIVRHSLAAEYRSSRLGDILPYFAAPV